MDEEARRASGGCERVTSRQGMRPLLPGHVKPGTREERVVAPHQETGPAPSDPFRLDPVGSMVNA